LKKCFKILLQVLMGADPVVAAADQDKARKATRKSCQGWQMTHLISLGVSPRAQTATFSKEVCNVSPFHVTNAHAATPREATNGETLQAV
jgi:hypothetical protein